MPGRFKGSKFYDRYHKKCFLPTGSTQLKNNLTDALRGVLTDDGVVILTVQEIVLFFHFKFSLKLCNRFLLQSTASDLDSTAVAFDN